MVQRKNFAVLKVNEKGAKSLKPEAMHTKIGFHAFHINSTCMNFLSLFLTPMNGPKGEFGCFEGKQKRDTISKTKEAMSIKIGFHAFHVNCYLHEFLSQF